MRLTQSISATACLLLVACGGSSSGRVTVEAVALHTRAARTARIDGSVKTTNPTSLTRFAGTADFSGSRYDFRLESPSPRLPFEELIVIGTHGFARESTRGSAVWCSIGTLSSDLNFDPSAVLRSIDTRTGTLQRVGEESVRGVATTHYRYVRPNNPPMELWVDSHDLLRRVVETRDSETDTAEFFAFGADLSIASPPTSPKCLGSSSSASGSSTVKTPTTTP